MSDCGIVILAAGSSSRLGRPKQLLQFRGSSLLRRAAETAIATKCRPIFVVLGAQSALSAGEISSLPVHFVINRDWEKGMGTSIRAGVSAIAAHSPSPASLVLMLCDQPLVTSAAIDELVRRRAASGKLICAACYSGMLGTPAVFSEKLFPELLQLGDSEGGKAIIARHRDDTEAMDLPAAAADIDTEADFQRLNTASPDSTRSIRRQ